MTAALALARRGLGTVWPNPAVGCIVVAADRVVGRGWTQPGGRPHAEAEALARAGAAAKGATAYVTLEPCAHHGVTPPCADALINAGISCCVVALADPDERVDGAGLDRMRAAGIAVELGVCADAAAEVNAGFLSRVTKGRPLVTLKLATTADGRIATATGESRWITGEVARAAAHGLRARHDAILVGAETARHDDPRLDCRLPGMEARSPVRIVLDGGDPLPDRLDLLARAKERPTWVIVTEEASDARRAHYVETGAEVVAVEADADGRPDIAASLAALGQHGITRLLVEGGSLVAAALMRARLVDRLVVFRSGRVIGGDGVPAVAGFGIAALDDAPNFVKLLARPVGADVMELYAAQG